MLHRVHGTSGVIRRHDIVYLLEFVRQSLLLRELVLVEGNYQLFVVFTRVRVQLVEGAVCVELRRVQLYRENTYRLVHDRDEHPATMIVTEVIRTLDSSASMAFMS